jgi:hypothetical protein
MMIDPDRGKTDSRADELTYKKTMHSFFMNCIDTLPESLRGLPLTADLAILNDGTLITFETNPGGNGYMVHHDEGLAGPHNDAIKKYVEKVSVDSLESPIHRGMTLEDQIIYLDTMMKSWNVSYEVHSPRYHTILPDRILSSQIAITDIKTDRFNKKAQMLAPKVAPVEIKDIAVEKGLKYVYNNLHKLATPRTALDLCHAIVTFLYTRKTMKPSSYEIVLNIKKELQEKYQKVMMEKFLKTLNQMKSQLPKKKKILSKSMKVKLANSVSKVVEEMGELQALDIEHSEIRKVVNEFFGILYEQDLSDWNTLFFKGFDVLGVKKFDALLKKFNSKSKGSKKKTIIKLTNICTAISDLFGTIKSLDRTGFVIPGFTPESFLELWTPRMRALYKVFLFDDAQLRNDKDKKEAFLQLAYAVTHLIYAVCDFSLFRLPKEPYLPEYEFLIQAARISASIGENDINGEIIDCLLLMGGAGNDTAIESKIQENQFFLVLNQASNGAWKNFGKADVHAIHTAITGLVDHEYALEGPKEFGKSVSFEEWKDKMNSLGLNLNGYDYFYKRPKHRNFDKIKKMVKKSFATRGLIQYFHDE